MPEARVAIVTGVAGGLGREIAAALSAEHWQVIGTDVSHPTSMPDGVEFVAADITSVDSVASVYEHVAERYGRLDGLVNNASIYKGLSPKGAFGDVSLDEFDLVMRVNVRGTWQMTAGAIALLTSSGGGSVVNISSGTNRQGVVGFPHYVASKAAVEGLTRAAARELGAAGIRVNAVAPGLVATPATLERVSEEARTATARLRSIPRNLDAVDVVGAVSFLLGDGSQLVTGQTIVVDGGEVFV